MVIQLWWLSLFSLDSLAVAAQGLVGTSIGQDQKTQARVVTNRILGWGLLAGTTAALVLGVGGSAVPQLFTEDVGVQDASMAPIMLIALLQPLNALVFVGDGVFQVCLPRLRHLHGFFASCELHSRERETLGTWRSPWRVPLVHRFLCCHLWEVGSCLLKKRAPVTGPEQQDSLVDVVQGA